jgi:hypothetical protein
MSLWERRKSRADNAMEPAWFERSTARAGAEGRGVALPRPSVESIWLRTYNIAGHCARIDIQAAHSRSSVTGY